MPSTDRPLPALRDDEMTPEQRALAAEMAGARGGAVGGPFALLLRVPEIGARVNALSERLRKNSGFEKRLVELLVLVITRDWNAQYAWTAHVRQALEEGIAPDAIEAIRSGATPSFARDDERLMYEVVSELIRTHALSDATYARAVAGFGLERTIELVTTAGLYTTISMLLATFRIPATNGERTLA